MQHIYSAHKLKSLLPVITPNGRYLNSWSPLWLTKSMKLQEILPSVPHCFQWKSTPVSEGVSKNTVLTHTAPENRNQLKPPLMGHEAEQNLVHSTVHNTNTYKKHINLLSLEGFYYYSFRIIFFPLQISYCIIKKLSSSQAVRWCYKRLCPISQRQSCKLSSAELQSIILSTGFLIKYYFFVYLYAKWIQPGRTFTKDEDIVVFFCRLPGHT